MRLRNLFKKKTSREIAKDRLKIPVSYTHLDVYKRQTPDLSVSP